jgi:murein DD-endopeptidase MepM/ murein hydrolase activator NlpD
MVAVMLTKSRQLVVPPKVLLAVLLAALLASCATSPDGRPAGNLILHHPLEKRLVTSEFGPRHGRMHQGIDYAAPIGTPVKAAGVGRVIFVGTKGRYGKLVIIEHSDGCTTYYAHLSKIYVNHGQRVIGGTRIGTVGKTGNATGPHLHFETRVKGKPVNPRIFFD